MFKKKVVAFIVIFLMGASILKAQEYLSTEPLDNKTMTPDETEFYEPVPPLVKAGISDNAPPSDAIILFDGHNLNKWRRSDETNSNSLLSIGNSKKDYSVGDGVNWTVENGYFTVKPGAGTIQTKQSFGDCQLHIEWRSPDVIEGNGQNRGNSGIFLQSQYELQVLDSYNNNTYTNGQAGSIYKDSPPLVNVSKRSGEWQSYDVIYHAPVFNGSGKVNYPATITVLQNGVLVQDHVSIHGKTLYIGRHYYEEHGPLPLALQDHNHPVSYRNIWIRPLN